MAPSLDDKMKAAGMAFVNEDHRQKQLTLASTGRHILISYPVDTTDDELLDFIGYLTHEFKRQLPQVGARMLPPGRLKI